jgi:primosomal replication protein N
VQDLAVARCRFVGLSSYPLCQDGEWIDDFSCSLYLIDAGVVHGTSWLSNASLDSEALSDKQAAAQQPAQLVGHGTAAWNPYVYVSPALLTVRAYHLACLYRPGMTCVLLVHPIRCVCASWTSDTSV